MQVDRKLEPALLRQSYTVIAEAIPRGAWHLTVVELPATWTVAFGREEVDRRARERIALDLGCHPRDFDIEVVDATRRL